MSNWAERAEQERRRFATEATIAQHTADAKSQANELDSKEQERIARQKLEIYKQLGIPKILEEIRRDIWQGRGKVDPSEFMFSGGIGYVGHSLSHRAVTDIAPKIEPIWIEKNGKHSVSYQSGPNGINQSRWEYGSYSEIDGHRLVGIESETRQDYHVGVGMSYKVSTKAYELRLPGQDMRFTEGSQDIATITGLVDQAFLRYSMHPSTPDFRKQEADIERQRNAIRRDLGKRMDF